jgi:hypothetical protein
MLIMKFKTIIVTLTLSTFSLWSLELYGQEKAEVTNAEQARMDNLRKLHLEEQTQTQDEMDSKRMTKVVNDRKATKAKAKEAKRVGKDADDAARESKGALKAEKKAQKARKQADKQAKKAAKARKTSNDN